MITLTEAAAKQVQSMVTEYPEMEHLRIAVKSGGCSGMEYGMSFDKPQEGDQHIETEGVKIIIDAKSLELIKGATINFDDGLHGKGFDIQNPNAHSTCGCGKSFS